MNKLLTILAASILFLAPLVAKAELKIAVVNAGYLYAKAPQVESTNKKLQKEFSGKESELKRRQEQIKKETESFQKNAATMSQSQATVGKRAIEKKIADFQFDQKAFKEDANRRSKEEQRKLGALIKNAIDAVAIRGGFNLVIEQQSAVYTDVKIPNITDQVMSELKK